MWKDKLKEVIYILENSNVNEIDVTFWGRRFRVIKSAGVNINSDSKLNQTSSVVSNEKPIPSQSKIAEDTKKDNSEEILSPMPGTFYSSPSPGRPGGSVSEALMAPWPREVSRADHTRDTTL